MPAVQLSLGFTSFEPTRALKPRALVAATRWKNGSVIRPEEGPSPSWVLPAAGLGNVDVATLRREIRPGWRQHARCARAEDPDAWFSDPASPEEDTAIARAECARCPVRRSCLAEAILGDEHGLWGGLTRRQRRTAADQLAPDADTGHRDWTGLLDALLLRLTLAAVPVIATSPVGRSLARPAGESAA